MMEQKVRLREDPISQVLWQNLNSEGRVLFDTQVSTNFAAECEAALLQCLNKTLTNGQLYTADRFRNIELNDKLRRLISGRYQGKALMHLNRLLLEAVYPHGLRKHDADVFNSFCPLYVISWRDKRHLGDKVASVRLFLPTKTLLSLRIEDSKYLKRNALDIPNEDGPSEAK